MQSEQSKDPTIVKLKCNLNTETLIRLKFLEVENVLHYDYLSNPDDKPSFRLLVPAHLRAMVIQQHHDKLDTQALSVCLRL